MIRQLFLCCFVSASLTALVNPVQGQSSNLEVNLKGVETRLLAQDIRRRGDAKRGALVFYTSAAGCMKCHSSGEGRSPLGPDLATIGKDVSDQYLVESLLYPSKDIRKGHETLTIVTTTGKLIAGLKVDDRNGKLVLRSADNLEKEIVVRKNRIDEITPSKKSMMPDGLIASLPDRRDFYDLARYVMEVAQGGPRRAADLKPAPEQLVVKDDSSNLDHAGILRRLRRADYQKGKRIYFASCVSCHGEDGKKASLPTARAFGTDKLKFGADPYRMFLTLTRGNGLMAPMRQLTPKQRYQVVLYVRERFMKGRNSDYRAVDRTYLESLPKGTESGEFVSPGERDYGPALASGLGRRLGCALTIKLGKLTMSYDLHTMDQAAVWSGGFLNFDQTLHVRMGGVSGLPVPNGKPIPLLAGWRWGHKGTLDYSHKGVRPRGPLPAQWFHYQGRYLHGDKVILSYEIDGREILEWPWAVTGATAVRHTLRIGPGDALLLAVADPPGKSMNFGVVKTVADERTLGKKGPARGSLAVIGKIQNQRVQTLTAAMVSGQIEGMKWTIDDKDRIVLHIPADKKQRLIAVTCYTGEGAAGVAKLRALARQKNAVTDPTRFLRGGRRRWPNVLTTVGYPGLEPNAYVLDTITVPDATPWNTWFRTTALDFFSDGRMAVATHGGDIWIVSGLDNDLLKVKWSRFASGLHEPMGVKIVDDVVYVTGKDGITRLHDMNKDGEADFYECFHADGDVSAKYHAFNFDLQRDPRGNFYYAKSGQYTDFALPGAVIQVSPDGKQSKVVATGFRTPNGLGVLPDGRITVSDNQGFWIPASKISILKQGSFYGYVRTSDAGRPEAKPPRKFEPPFIWMPQELDNSSSGQLWVADARWGPLSKHLLHTSYGKGWLYYLMIQDIGDVSQAAIIKLPHHFATGIMRAAVNPADGQVYVVGLQGWNANGRPGLREHGIQRLRYTGKPVRVVTDCQVEKDGLRIRFNFPLDQESAKDLQSWIAEQWNYRWGPQYGSRAYSPTTKRPGKDQLKISSIALSKDGRSVKLMVPTLRPVHQIHLRCNVKGRDGVPFNEELYWTIHRVPHSSEIESERKGP